MRETRPANTSPVEEKDSTTQINTLLVETGQAEHVIPNIIHFIWVGDNPMPLEQIEAVNKWAKCNPAFQIFFWY